MLENSDGSDFPERGTSLAYFQRRSHEVLVAGRVDFSKLPTQGCMCFPGHCTTEIFQQSCPPFFGHQCLTWVRSSSLKFSPGWGWPATLRSYSHWFRGALCQCQAVPRGLAVPLVRSDGSSPLTTGCGKKLVDVIRCLFEWQILSGWWFQKIFILTPNPGEMIQSS